MSQLPIDLRYTKSHEWLRELGDDTVEIGITDHAQGALGDLVFVEVPEVDRGLRTGDAAATVESVKAASDVYSPVSGRVIAANAALATRPELLNEDPCGAGWVFRLELGGSGGGGLLMSAAEYGEYLTEQAH